MIDLYIVRHGNTFEADETPRRVGAATDLPLTAAGLEQARALGRHFAAAGIVFSRALSSPLRRTLGTAQAILDLQPQPMPIETAAFLTEIDHGPDEDQPEAEVARRLGTEALEQWDRLAIAPPGWTVDADGRIAAWRRFLGTIAGLPGDQAILLCTSNGAARFALIAFGLASRPELATVKLRTGSYGTIRIGVEAIPSLLQWNRRPD